MGRKIAILGKAPDSMMEAPFSDPDWEIWTINNSAYKEQIPRWDRQFELHPIHWTQEPEYEGYYEWLTKQEKPIYLQSAVEEIPAGVVYPLAELTKHFDGPGARYFTNSIAYMLALAVFEFDNANEPSGEIGLWGVNMAQHGVGVKSEYAIQRPSCEFWCGVARGRGYQLHLPKQSDLLHSSCLYGFDMGGEIWDKMKAREAELAQRATNAENVQEQAKCESYFLRGAMEDCKYWKQWIPLAGGGEGTQ